MLGALIAAWKSGTPGHARETWTLWALMRAGAEDEFFAGIAADVSSPLNSRLQALRILGGRKSAAIGGVVASALDAAEPRVRFAAVQAVHQARLAPLTAHAATEQDRVAYYATWHALRDLAGVEKLRPLLADRRGGVRSAALLALLDLQAMPKAELPPFLHDEDERVRRVAALGLGIGSRPSPKASPAAAPPFVPVTKIVAESGRSYQAGTLRQGQPSYTDRNYVFKQVPEALREAFIIRTANEDDHSQGCEFSNLRPRPGIHCHCGARHAHQGTSRLAAWFRGHGSPRHHRRQVTRNFPPVKGQDATDHDTIHPGLALAFGDLNGVDFWRNQGRIEHVRMTQEPHVGSGRLSFAVEEKYLAPDGTEVCRGVNEFRFVAGDTLQPALPGTLLMWSTTLHRKDGPLIFGPQHEMGLSFRMATPLVVKGGSGSISSSHGGKNEAGNWGRIATWWDYTGTVNGRHAGILTVAAADNARPVWSHARDYGFLAMNPTGPPPGAEDVPSVPFTIPAGGSLRMKFGILLHASAAPLDAAEAGAAVSAELSAWK